MSQSHENSPETPEQQLLQEGREHATEYAVRRLDTMGVDGKPLHHVLSMSIIQNVSNEGIRILVESIARTRDGETTDVTKNEQALILIRMADEAMISEALRSGTPEEIKHATQQMEEHHNALITGLKVS